MWQISGHFFLKKKYTFVKISVTIGMTRVMLIFCWGDNEKQKANSNTECSCVFDGVDCY